MAMPSLAELEPWTKVATDASDDADRWDGECLLLPAVEIATHHILARSSEVEQATVNRLVAGSNPAASAGSGDVPDSWSTLQTRM